MVVDNTIGSISSRPQYLNILEGLAFNLVETKEKLVLFVCFSFCTFLFILEILPYCHHSYNIVKLLDWGEDGKATSAETAAVRAAFQQEVAVWHKLDHPNVTKVYIFHIH